MQARTLASITKMCRLEFNKSDLDLEKNLAAMITDELREICADFPYWFLRVMPGMLVPSQFPVYADETDPVGTLLSGQWLDQGWLRVLPGRGHYEVHTALVEDPFAPTGWGCGEVRNLNFVKRYSTSGSFQGNLNILHDNQFFSAGGFQATASGTGCNESVMLHTMAGKSYLRFQPAPTEATVYAVGYQLALPPWVAVGDTYTNLISQYYPRAVELLGLMRYARWFKETKLYELYKRELYGDTDRGIIRADIPHCGLVGKMKQDTEVRQMAETHEMPHYHSMSDGLGQVPLHHRGPGSVYYEGPTPYG